MEWKEVKRHQAFGGETVFCQHTSEVTKTPMGFSYYRPAKTPVRNLVLWLSGLTCSEENFMVKAGAQSWLNDTQSILVCPDTSPRGLNLPGEHDTYDFGSGAGFYLNACTPVYKEHYRMYDYVLTEFVPLLKKAFAVSEVSISGHSMGGHGALVLGLRNPDVFSKISAFSPIVNPTHCPWGQKAFQGYLGEDRELWKLYDACELVKSGHTHKERILIDQGLSDEFLEKQLLTSNFEEVCKAQSQSLKVNYREGYDHSYYFVASFIKSHLEHLGVS